MTDSNGKTSAEVEIRALLHDQASAIRAKNLDGSVSGYAPGDPGGLPRSRLAMLPGTTHVTLIERVDWLAPVIAEFFDAPTPDMK